MLIILFIYFFYVPPLNGIVQDEKVWQENNNSFREEICFNSGRDSWTKLNNKFDESF